MALGKFPHEIDAMPHRDFAGLLAEYRKEPFGESRADVQSAVIAKTIADVHRTKHSPQYKLQDFMPYVPKQKGMDAAAFRKSMSHLVVKKNG